MFISKLSRKLILKSTSSYSVRMYSGSSESISDSNADTVELAYAYYGNTYHDTKESPVIILHGLLASKNSWKRMGEAIHHTTGRNVISVDARNHGDSQHSREHSYVHMARDTANLIKKLDLEKVTLLGHSMGGRTAMLVSLLYPQLVSSLLIVDISPVSISDQANISFPRLFKVIANIDFKGITNIEDATRFAVEQLRAFDVTQEDVIDVILKNVGIKPDKTIGWISNIEVLKEKFSTLLKFPHVYGRIFPGPTLFLGAGQSGFIPPEDLFGIKGYFPRAQLKYIPGVGHNIQNEHPSMFLKLTTEFLLKHI